MCSSQSLPSLTGTDPVRACEARGAGTEAVGQVPSSRGIYAVLSSPEWQFSFFFFSRKFLTLMVARNRCLTAGCRCTSTDPARPWGRDTALLSGTSPYAAHTCISSGFPRWQKWNGKGAALMLGRGGSCCKDKHGKEKRQLTGMEMNENGK